MTNITPKLKVLLPGKKIRIDGVRLSYPSLWTPKEFQGQPGSKAKYHATVLIPKTAKDVLEGISKEVEKAVREEFPGKVEKVLATMRNQPNYRILKDGDLKPDTDGYPGCFYLHASNTRPPLVVDERRDPLPDDGTLAAGDYVNIIVTFFSSKQYNIISTSLTSVQKAANGDRFTTSAANADDFDDVSTDDANGTDGNEFF